MDKVSILFTNLAAASTCGFERHKTEAQKLVFFFNEYVCFETKGFLLFRKFSLVTHYFLGGEGGGLGGGEECVFIYRFLVEFGNKNYLTSDLYAYRKRSHNHNKNSPFFSPLHQNTVQFSSFITYQWNAKLVNLKEKQVNKQTKIKPTENKILSI